MQQPSSAKQLRFGQATKWATSLLVLTLAGSLTSRSYAEQPPAPCHPNPLAAQDEATVRNRGDIVNLPMPLKNRLARLANRPHSQLPLQVYAEANGASQLFQYYLLDTGGFQPNVFTLYPESPYPESPFFTLNQLGINTQYLRTQKASRILGPRRLWRPSGPAAL